MAQRILDRQFYNRDPIIVAKQILGMQLVSTIGGKRTSGIIVETEAYLANGDSASHSARGQTNKNFSLFGTAGFAYVYSIHAKYCFNVVTERSSIGSAVLIRAVEPVDGIKTMRTRRQQNNLLALCSGPAKLCQALSISQSIDGLDLTKRRTVWIQAPAGKPIPQSRILATRRIGVTSAKSKLLRFVFRNHTFASGPKYLR